MNTMQQHIQMSVDETGFIKAMKNGFESPLSVIKELAQNSRRAGAKKIEFFFSEDANNFTIVDDGKGITDFEKLIAAYKSDWDEHVKSETPYGVGFLSCILASDFISVSSNGKKLEANTDDIITFKQIPIVDCDNDGQTRIMLSGELIRKLFDADFEKIFAGFPVQVFVNDIELMRHHSLSEDFVSMSAGFIALHCTVEPLYYAEDVSLYYQGFKIGSVCLRSKQITNINDWKRVDFKTSDRETILHLDHERFPAIAPDRHILVDAVNALNMIADEVMEFVQADVIAKHKLYGDEWLLNSFSIISRLSMKYLYNNIDRVPKKTLRCPSDYPVKREMRMYHNSEFVNADTHITRSQVENGEILVFSSEFPDDDDYDENFCALMYCWLRKNCYILRGGALDPEHWIYSYLHDAEDVTYCAVDVKEPSSSQSENGLSHRAAMCKHIILSGPCGEIVCTESMMTPEGVFIVDGDNSDIVVSQSSSYVDEFDTYREYAHDLDRENFSTWINTIRNENDPTALLMQVLKSSIMGWSREGEENKYPSLKGKSFSLRFDEHGQITCSQV